MTDIPPSLFQPPHDHFTPLLGANTTQEPVAPFPYYVTRVVRVAWPAANLRASETWVCGDFASEVESRGGRGRGKQQGGAAGSGE